MMSDKKYWRESIERSCDSLNDLACVVADDLRGKATYAHGKLFDSMDSLLSVQDSINVLETIVIESMKHLRRNPYFNGPPW